MRMARPWKHPTTGIYYTQIEIPQKLRAAFKARWGQEYEIKVSLWTKDPETAKRRHHIAGLEYQRRVDELSQPTSPEDLARRARQFVKEATPNEEALDILIDVSRISDAHDKGKEPADMLPARLVADAFDGRDVGLAGREALAEAITDAAAKRHTIIEAFEHWQSEVPDRSDKVVADARRAIDKFIEITGQRTVEQTKRRDVIKFRDARLKDGLRPNTVRKDISLIRQVFGCALDREWIDANPAGEVRFKRGHRRSVPSVMGGD